MLPLTEFKIRCHRDIEKQTSNVSYVKNPLGVFFQYTLGQEKKNFHMLIQDLAEMLIEFGVIDRLVYDGSRPVMQTKVLFSVSRDGVPVQYVRYVEYKWQDIQLDPMVVQSIIVMYEFDRVNKIAKLVDLGKDYFKKTG